MPDNSLDGGCLCGEVRYRLTAAPIKTNYCHCRMCQRSAGAPVIAWTTVPRSAFVYVKGAPKVYHSSGKAQREFCPGCGTQLVFREHGYDAIDITTASLDDPGGIAPVEHIWCESRIPWFETADSLPRRDQ